MDDKIQKFLQSTAFGVVGASTDKTKYGNKVLRCYLQHQKKAYAVNPKEMEVEKTPCFHTVSELPKEVNSISVITPPKVTEKIVIEAIQKGIQHIWLQPGAESHVAVDYCKSHQVNVIWGGPCILVQLGFQG